jgi:Bacterial Ig domain/Calcineurin-like phosphoesterase
MLAVVIVALGTHPESADGQTLVPAGSSWKYNDSGSNLGTAWRAVTYNDASWSTGAAQLGYGDGDESTVLSYGSNPNNRRITYYFRRSFGVANPASISALTVRFVRDDGLVIYLNGTQVVRSNMPAGTISYTTRATTAIGPPDESAWQQAAIDPSLLVAGTNVLAVELHQQSPTSTDISFDLELNATQAQAPAPTVSLMSPANHGVSNTPDVTFSASVSATAGLVSATLFVGGAPRTVVFSGPQIEDAQITADTPTFADGSGASINVDGQSPHAHGLMKFPTLVGAGSGQVPPGAIITSAMLQLNCTNAGNTMALYRLTQSWVEDEATWNERSIGSPWASAGADGTGSNAGVALPGDCTVTGQRLVDITLFAQEWANGALNHGIVLIESGTDGIDFSSSESGTSPALTVTYRSSQQPVATTQVSGPSALVSFATTLPMGQTYFWNVHATDTTGAQSWAPSDFDVTVDASSPDEPVLVSPANGSTGVVTSPALSALVSDPAGGSLNVSVALRRAAAPEFTIIALPDTQHYSEAFPAVFTSQTQWIVDNKDARNIVFVTHEGDIVEHNGLNSEWLVAIDAMGRLDGHVPYGMGPGNHDQPTTLYNQYFPYTRYQNETWYGGHFQNLNDNNFQLFSGGGLNFVIVHLEFCPPATAVSWASGVFATYPDRIGIVTTHGYLGLAAQRSVNLCTNTQYLWDGLAVPNPNLHFMLAGHVHGESRRVDTANGHSVFQMLADYQDRATGGEGWLRILRFVPSEDRVYVQTYSPWLNRFETDADSEFALDFLMGGVFADAGTTTAASGSTASITPPALAPFTQYEWRMSVTNGSGRTRTGPVWTFTTGAGGSTNQPPTATSQSVSTAEDSATPITLAAVDPEGGPLTYVIVSGPSFGTLIGSGPSLMYQPAANYSGTDSFTFRASDGQATSNLATVAIAIQAVNDPPSATGESYTIQGGGTLTVSAPGLLSNDSDIDSGTLTARLLSGPAHGALALNANGSFSYTPSGGYSGPDLFTYVLNDGQADSGVAIVSLTVTSANAPPTVAAASAASPNPVSGTTTGLSVLGADDSGEASLTYTWATTGAPPAPVAFSANGTNAAKNTVGTFTRAGTYSVQVTIRDAGSLTATSSVTVTVSQALTSIVVTPPSPSVAAGGTQLFTATGNDQFGAALSPQPAVTWAVSGGGTISPAGLFTSGSTAGGPFAVTATNGAVSGTASVTVTLTAAVPAYVQGSATTNDGGANSMAQAFTAANTVGNLIVAAVSWDSEATVTCSDSQGNAYVVATTQYDSSNDQSLAICYAVNVRAGVNTVTANFSEEVTWRRMAIHEYSGVALTSPVDVVARNVANGTTAANGITSTAAVTTISGDLIFAAVMDDAGATSITAGTGFTQRLAVNNKDLATEDRVQPTAGSISATQTFGAAHRYLAQMVAFKHR